MDVRLARPTDAPLVLALALDENAHIVRGPDWPATRPVVRSIGRSVVPLALPGRTWVARDDAGQAILEALPRRYVIGWDITRLVVRGDRDTMLPPIIEVATGDLQARGVPRLFARCREESREELEQFGFRPLGREYVFIGKATVDEAEPLPEDSRYRMPQDAWPLHQLESQVTPPLVRQLEGLTSLDWAVGAKRLEEIVVERDGRVTGWIGWGTRKATKTMQLGLLVHPDHAELASCLLEYVLQQAPKDFRIVARVRDYQPEAMNALEAAGFNMAAEEILLIRHGRVALVPAEPARLRARASRVPSVQAFPIHVINPGPLSRSDPFGVPRPLRGARVEAATGPQKDVYS